MSSKFLSKWGFCILHIPLMLRAGRSSSRMSLSVSRVSPLPSRPHFSPSPTLSLDGVGVDGCIGAARGTARLQHVAAQAAGQARQPRGLQQEGLAVLGQQLGPAGAGGVRREALRLGAREVTPRVRLLPGDSRGSVLCTPHAPSPSTPAPQRGSPRRYGLPPPAAWGSSAPHTSSSRSSTRRRGGTACWGGPRRTTGQTA